MITWLETFDNNNYHFDNDDINIDHHNNHTRLAVIIITVKATLWNVKKKRACDSKI
jgi:hypothetical protein